MADRLASKDGLFNRRAFLRYGATTVAMTAAAPALGSAVWTPHAAAQTSFEWEDASIADLQAAMESGALSALDLTRAYIARIEAMDWAGPQVNSVLEINPDAESIAEALDLERSTGNVRGPLHGIPILLKDSIATADRMETTAGSLALLGSKVPRDAGVARKLRAAGAVLLGKNNLSEWSSFRDATKTNGWSARGGLCVNPYALGFSAGESSNGAAASVSSSFTAGAVGTETFGSTVLPAAMCGVVGLKPTLGLTSRSGVIPISMSRDVTGPIGRTVADVATLLGGMVGVDRYDEATQPSAGRFRENYRIYLDPDGLRGARMGVWRNRRAFGDFAEADLLLDRSIQILRELGALVIDPIEPEYLGPGIGEHVGVMIDEFRHGIKRYLRELTDTTMRTLSDLIAFNEQNADAEMRWFGQAMFETANGALPLTHPAHLRELHASRRLSRRGFTDVMRKHRLDAIVARTWRPAWAIDLLNHDPVFIPGASGPSNAAGYPHITVPAGYDGELPIGLSFLARAWSEPKLLKYAYAFEQAAQARHAPKYLEGYAKREFIER